jgi:hypothetical protein
VTAADDEQVPVLFPIRGSAAHPAARALHPDVTAGPSRLGRSGSADPADAVPSAA